MSDLQALQAGEVRRDGERGLCPVRASAAVHVQRAFAQLPEAPASSAGSGRGAQSVGGVRVDFTIPGNPVGKGRPRVGKRGRFTQLYTPEKTASYESLVKMAGHQGMCGRALFLDAVAVVLDICVPIPASWSDKKRGRAAAGEIYPTTKPDIDNVEKAIFDGLNGIAWKDDVQVVRVTKQKRYSLVPGVQVSIQPLNQ